MNPAKQNQEPTLFTAEQIARGLAVETNAIWQALRAVPPSGNVIVRGQPTEAWTVASLPKALRDAIDSLDSRSMRRMMPRKPRIVRPRLGFDTKPEKLPFIKR